MVARSPGIHGRILTAMMRFCAQSAASFPRGDLLRPYVAHRLLIRGFCVKKFAHKRPFDGKRILHANHANFFA